MNVHATTILSDLNMALSLARTAQEAVNATPQGEGTPTTVTHALALLIERLEIIANDVNAEAEADKLAA